MATDLKYLNLLKEKYPSPRHVFTEIINLNAILNLPKGTEHFISDLHGEFEAFYHIINNCSGVIREKISMLFAGVLTESEMSDLATLVYYPAEKLKDLASRSLCGKPKLRDILEKLISLLKLISSKYTRSKVRKALPKEFSYIIDELLHAQPDEDENQKAYHSKILDTIVDTGCGEDFIVAIATLIKKIAVAHIHILGDIFDRGPSPDKILDVLENHHSVDICFGNHDILWMGACAGSLPCIAAAIRNNLAYENLEFLESGYGISLRSLALLAEKQFPSLSLSKAMMLSISLILFKLEGQLIKRHPEFRMEDRLLLHKISSGEVEICGEKFKLNFTDFSLLDNPYDLTDEETTVILSLQHAFKSNERLKRHINFLYSHGSLYKIHNGNLLFHGCIPLDNEGNLKFLKFGGLHYGGKGLMDYCDDMARKAFFREDNEKYLDFMYFLWCGENSPLCGKKVKTFERAFLMETSAHHEPRNPYYTFNARKSVAEMILHEFGLFAKNSHIINGHTPIKVRKGESPVKAEGKMIVIDGGFTTSIQKSTGIAGYTLVYNSHSLTIKSHMPFETTQKAILENADIFSTSTVIEKANPRVYVKDTDGGKVIKEKIVDLKKLLEAFYAGDIKFERE